jgi:hypothetical protein
MLHGDVGQHKIRTVKLHVSITLIIVTRPSVENWPSMINNLRCKNPFHYIMQQNGHLGIRDAQDVPRKCCGEGKYLFKTGNQRSGLSFMLKII